jgi:hypothetical protein
MDYPLIQNTTHYIMTFYNVETMEQQLSASPTQMLTGTYQSSVNHFTISSIKLGKLQ